MLQCYYDNYASISILTAERSCLCKRFCAVCLRWQVLANNCNTYVRLTLTLPCNLAIFMQSTGINGNTITVAMLLQYMYNNRFLLLY